MSTNATSGLSTLFQLSRDGGSTYSTIGEVTNINAPSHQTQFLDATHMEAANNEIEEIPELKTPQDITIDVNFLPGNQTHQDLETDRQDRTERDFKIIWPDTANTEIDFKGWVVNVDVTAAPREVLSASITIHPSGDRTNSWE